MKIYEVTQPIAEIPQLTEEQLKPLTEGQLTEDLASLLRYGDDMLNRAGIPLRFAASAHFKDRLDQGRDQGNGDRNNVKEITDSEMQNLIQKVIKKHGKKLEDMDFDEHFVVHDGHTNINVPFVKAYQRDGSTALVAKTILRSGNIRTSDPILRV